MQMERQVSKKYMSETLKNWWRTLISELEMPKASAFGRRGHIPPGQQAGHSYVAIPNAT